VGLVCAGERRRERRRRTQSPEEEGSSSREGKSWAGTIFNSPLRPSVWETPWL